MAYRAQILCAAVLLSTLLSLTLIGSAFVSLAKANPDPLSLVFAMPEEYINYTITCVNGTLWAKIDGLYPIYVLAVSEIGAQCALQELPMYYPIPPGTTNIQVKLNGTDLSWHYYPYDTHHTAIGDWAMIRCVLKPVSEHFVLSIHYEHPVQLINGSYVFLYDLNIREYLSPLRPNSTAYFTIRFDVNVSDVQAYTTASDSAWNVVHYTKRQENGVEIVTLKVYSEYSKPLPGDLAITFKLAESTVKNATFWLLMLPLLIVLLLSPIVYRQLKQRKIRRATRIRNELLLGVAFLA